MVLKGQRLEPPDESSEDITNEQIATDVDTKDLAEEVPPQSAITGPEAESPVLGESAATTISQELIKDLQIAFRRSNDPSLDQSKNKTLQTNLPNLKVKVGEAVLFNGSNEPWIVAGSVERPTLPPEFRHGVVLFG